MKTAIIIAGGEGVRLGGKPKALADIAGRTLIRRSIDHWRRYVDRFVFVLNTYGEEIAAEIRICLSDEYISTHIVHEEKPPTGIASALLAAEPHVPDDQFFVILGDQLFDRFHFDDRGTPDVCGLGVLTFNQFRELQKLNYAVSVERGQRVVNVLEKPTEMKDFGDYCGIGFYVLDQRIFEHCAMHPGLTEAIASAIAAGVDFWPMYHDGRWTHVTTEQDLKEANEWFSSRNLR